MLRSEIRCVGDPPWLHREIGEFGELERPPVLPDLPVNQGTAAAMDFIDSTELRG